MTTPDNPNEPLTSDSGADGGRPEGQGGIGPAADEQTAVVDLSAAAGYPPAGAVNAAGYGPTGLYPTGPQPPYVSTPHPAAGIGWPQSGQVPPGQFTAGQILPGQQLPPGYVAIAQPQPKRHNALVALLLVVAVLLAGACGGLWWWLANQGDDEITSVSVCEQAPVFTTEEFRTDSAGLVAKMQVSANESCTEGDLLAGPETRVTILDAGQLVASGAFDFTKMPIAIPPTSGSRAGKSATVELTFPEGAFFRLPDTLEAGGSYAVDTDRGPAGAVSSADLPESEPSAYGEKASGPAFPPGTDLNQVAGASLRVQAESDREFILANLNNRWVAQLSSKREGLYADGKTWTNRAIMDEFLALRLRFSDARLLWSDEWPVFSYRGWWVTVATVTFAGPDAALTWCRQQGFDREHCFAKMVSTSAGPETSTKY